MVVALGSTTNLSLIPGSHAALTFESVTDALLLRNQPIERLERADASVDETARRRWLTVAVTGGGLVGVELLGELTAFVGDELRYRPRLRRDELRFHLLEAGPRILPELDPAPASSPTRRSTPARWWRRPASCPTRWRRTSR